MSPTQGWNGAASTMRAAAILCGLPLPLHPAQAAKDGCVTREEAYRSLETPLDALPGRAEAVFRRVAARRDRG